MWRMNMGGIRWSLPSKGGYIKLRSDGIVIDLHDLAFLPTNVHTIGRSLIVKERHMIIHMSAHQAFLHMRFVEVR